MELSVFDLSKHLDVTTSTIERWLRQGTLPVSRKGANIKFQVKELEKWASKHNLVLNLSENTALKKKKSPPVSLSSAIRNGGIYTDVPGHDTQSVLKNSIENISCIPQDDKEELLSRLIERENALSTGIGNGIAIPHPREQVTFIEQPLVAVSFLKTPVDYQALDNKPVSALFILLCPELKMHLQLLSALSFCLKNPGFTDFLRTEPDTFNLVDKIDALLKENPLS
jgi:PTS system nitrogen regulatory IIA component